MEDKGKDKLPNTSLENKEKEEPQSSDTMGTPDNRGVDTSEEESDKLGSKNKEEKVEEESGQVTSYFKLDEKGEKQIKDLLQEELKSEVQDIKKDFLIIFGLFVSFVTFISINVQVFKNSKNLFDIIGVISISLSFIIFFALVINSVVKKQLEWSDLKEPVYIINLVFLVIGVVFLSYGESRDNNKIEDLNKIIVSDSLNIRKIINEIDSLNNQFDIQDSTINILTKTIEELRLDYDNFKDKNELEKEEQSTKATPNKGSSGN